METEAINLDDYMKDAQGRLVHKDNVKEIDKMRDELIRNLVQRARNLQKELERYKELALGEIDSFISLSAQEYNVILGGQKGNLTLLSYDGSLKAQVQIHERMVLDERIHAAKALIDECLNRWSADSCAEIKTIINDAFAVDKEGRINVKRILALKKLDIEDEVWRKAMTIVGESLTVVGSKSYFRLYERSGAEDAWKHINLDFAGI